MDKKLTAIRWAFSCKYHHGGYRYVDRYQLIIHLEQTVNHCFAEFYQNGGNMRQEITPEQLWHLLATWTNKIGTLHEKGYLGYWQGSYCLFYDNSQFADVTVSIPSVQNPSK